MSAQRLPAAFITSAGLHAAAFGLFLYASRAARREAPRVISNVDLLIQVKKTLPVPQAAQEKAKQSTFDFLKLALPSIPKPAAPKLVDVKLPEARKPLSPEMPEKIVEKQRRFEAPKLDGLDLSRRDAAMAKIEANISSRRTSALAEAPKLEEVGRRRVKDLPAALALEESRREAVALKALQPALVADKRRQPVMAPALQEAAGAPPAAGLASKLSRLLPQELPQALPRQGPAASAAPLAKPVLEQKPAARRAQALLGEEKKKGVELEGPIADRKVAVYEIPEFPAWAREQGVLEASVAIRFWVSPRGEVLADMRVERTSGYGRLDRHAMESLKKWRFAPVSSQEKQWGVITFRFVLE